MRARLGYEARHRVACLLALTGAEDTVENLRWAAIAILGPAWLGKEDVTEIRKMLEKEKKDK